MRIAVLDVGGTAIKSGVWEDGHLTEGEERDTNAKNGGEYVLSRMMEIISGMGKIDAIGISTAGQVNTEDGSIYYANQNIPGYTGIQVKKRLQEIFHVPAAVENDVNAAALGEMYYGAGRGMQDFLCLTYGTGIGGAIVMNRRIYPGASYCGGCFGGIIVHPEDIRPEDPYSGGYEKYASVTALVQNVQKTDAAMKDGRMIFSAMDRPEIRKRIDEWIDEIVYGLLTLVHIFNPSDLILGGGVMAQDYVLEEVRKRLDQKMIPGCRGVRLHQAELGNQAGLLGAAGLAESAYSSFREMA